MYRLSGYSTQKCKYTSTLEDVIGNVKNSVAFENLQTDLTTLYRTFHSCVKGEENKFDELSKQKLKIKNNVREIFDQIRKTVDDLRRNTKTKIDTTFTKSENEINETFQTLKQTASIFKKSWIKKDVCFIHRDKQNEEDNSFIM